MEKKWIALLASLFVIVLALILFMPRGSQVEVTLPHNGEKISLTTYDKTGGQYRSINASLDSGGRRVEYSYQGGYSSSGSGGTGTRIAYSDSSLEYVYETESGLICPSECLDYESETFACLRGDCGNGVSKNRTEQFSSRFLEPGEKGTYISNSTQCFANGSFRNELVTEKEGMASTSEGAGCPI